MAANHQHCHGKETPIDIAVAFPPNEQLPEVVEPRYGAFHCVPAPTVSLWASLG